MAAETGIAPSELARDGSMLVTIAQVLNERNRKRRAQK